MSKQTTLAEAAARHVRPGDQLHFAFTHNRSHAAAFEVARQFRHRSCLELVATGLLDYALVLSAAGAIARFESAFAGTTYPGPAPLRALSEALTHGNGVVDPDWTNLTVTLRLMAGAMGWPFVPTTSLAGSGLARGPGRAEVTGRFGGGTTMVLAPLRPDVCFLHAALADTRGNAVVYGPDAEGMWGAWAAERVVVTAERVVPPESLRALGPRPGFPGHRVDAVVEAPFGAHPQGVFVWNAADPVEGYAEDYAMRRDLRRRASDPAGLRDWLEAWVFLDGGHDTYLARLGTERIEELRQRAGPGWLPERHTAAPVDASPEERAAVLAARVAQERATQGSHDAFFAGIGLSHLAAWLAAERCRAHGIEVDLVAETGMLGFRRVPGDPYLFNHPNARSSLFHSGFVPMLGALAGPRARRCLVFLGAAQVDRAGNANSSRTGEGRFLVGSGGANDLASGGGHCLLVIPVRRGRLVAEVPFVTSPARRLLGVATDAGLLTPSDEDGTLRLQAVMAPAGGERAAIEALRAACDWPLAIADELQPVDPPTGEELEMLRSFDPHRDLLS